MEKEIWKDIKDYEGLYEVSNLGQIKSLERVDNLGRRKTTKIIKPTKFKNGYFFVSLSKNGKSRKYSVHRLVINNFIKEDRNLVVNHIDGNKANNKIKNLELITQKENIRHAWDQKLSKPTRIKEVKQYDLFGNFIRLWESATEVERQLKISNSHINSCCKGTRKTAGGYRWEYANNY